MAESLAAMTSLITGFVVNGDRGGLVFYLTPG